MPKSTTKTANVEIIDDAQQYIIVWNAEGNVNFDIMRSRKIVQDGKIISMGAAPSGPISRGIVAGSDAEKVSVTIPSTGREITIGEVLEALQEFHDVYATENEANQAAVAEAEAKRAQAELERAQAELARAQADVEKRKK